jgi:O-antigen/teichoic acid export membrane protein
MLKWIKARWAGRTNDDILRHGAIHFFFFGTVTIVNIAARKYVSGTLTIEDYGVFTALLAFYSILAQPFNVMQMIITKNMSYRLGRGETADALGYFRWIFKLFVFISFCAMLCILIFSPFLQEQYQLPTLFSVLVVVGMFFVASITYCYAGALQAFQKFGVFGFINTLAACVKILFCYVLLHLFFGDIFPAPVAVSQSLVHITRISAGFINRFDTPMLAILLSMCAFAVLSAIAFKRITRGVTVSPPCETQGHVRALVREFFPIFILFFAFSLFRNIDEYMARRFLSEFDNGLYGALATVAKSSIFLMSSIAFVTFPKFAAHADDLLASRRILYKSLLLGAISISALFVLILLFPELLMRGLTHSKYLSAAPYLKYFFLAFVPYPVVFIFVNYFIVHRDWRYILMLLGFTLLVVPAYELYSGTISEILHVLGISGYIILTFSLVYWLRKTRIQRPPRAEGQPGGRL